MQDGEKGVEPRDAPEDGRHCADALGALCDGSLGHDTVKVLLRCLAIDMTPLGLMSWDRDDGLSTVRPDGCARLECGR